jgi:hypothetical protein
VSGSDEFAYEGGLESEPVYTVYFKWKSTVATIGGVASTPQRDVWTNGNGTGIGDPCQYVNGAYNYTRWVTPSGPWRYNNSYPFGRGGGVGWMSTAAGWRQGETLGGVTMSGAATNDGRVWLPAAGYRTTTTMTDYGTAGYYWTTTAGTALSFDGQGANASATHAPDHYLPVRCVIMVAE